jgi:hypothetical protein
MPADLSVDLAALDALWKAATPGEWMVTADEPKRVYRVDGHGRFWPVFDAAAEDATFIAALHNAWPALHRRLEIGDAAVEVIDAEAKERVAMGDFDKNFVSPGDERERVKARLLNACRVLNAARARLSALRAQSDAA